MPERCKQAWAGGLSPLIVSLTGGILTECKHDAGHRGKHRSEDGATVWWGGKLTDDEMAVADRLRESGDSRA
ncbi:hypothetical protein [Agrococcus jejuensis]|uniref:hypothetical protein n=1 Tax=Agrococcus jejuensis TaxID=399736 RepID=UPI0011A9025E|nr:hypothetical protein [Agrococcus jejuensis]